MRQHPYATIERTDFSNSIVFDNLVWIENYWMWTSIWHTKTVLNVSFKFMDLLMRLPMLLPAQHLLPLYWSLGTAKPKIWMHTNHCLSSAKAIPIQEVQNLLCVDAAASYAENLCMWCLASPMDIFGDILFQNLWNNSASLKRLTKQRFNNTQTVEKEFFICIIEICCNSGMLVKSYRYWLLNWQP